MAKHLIRLRRERRHPADAGEWAPDLLATWLRLFPESVPTEGLDREDWVEQEAGYLHAFETLGADYEILENHARGGFVSCTSDFIVEGDGEPAFFHVGINAMDQMEGVGRKLPLQTPTALGRIGEHATSETFRARAGREMILVRPNRSEIEAAVARIVPEGGPIFIKSVRKCFAQVVKIEAGREAWPQICQELDGIEWDLVQFDGSQSPIYSIQGAIRPTFEYRVFMVDHVPVTGAGCVENFTPLENKRAFDPKMEEVRNQSDVTEQDELVVRYRRFATEFGKEFAAETDIPMAYSLDLCVDANTGEIVPIELNPPLNLGRYASRLEAWITAVDEAMERVA